MKARVLLGFLLLIGMGYFYNKHQQTRLETTHSQAHQITEPVTNQTPITPNKQPLKEPKAVIKTPAYTQHQLDLLAEIEDRKFSDDAAVELRSLTWNYGVCFEKVEINRIINHPNYESPQKQQYVDLLLQECQAIQIQYPSLNSQLENNAFDETFKPSSELGRLLLKRTNDGLTHIEREKLDELILIKAIQNGNGAIMMSSALIQGFMGNTGLPIKQVIQSNDSQYTNQMSQLAIYLLSCQYQNGSACKSTSTLMILQCSQQPSSCGLDFTSWYEQNTLPGMRRDVEKLMNYYLQFAN